MKKTSFLTLAEVSAKTVRLDNPRRESTSRRGFCARAVAGVGAMVLGACGKKPVAGLDSSNKVRVGYIGITCEAPIFMAVEQGFFKEEGLDVELVKCEWSKYKDVLALGGYDITHHLIMYFLKPIEQGLDVKFTAGIHTGCLRVQAGKDGPISSVKDLKGKRIGCPGMGTPPFIFANRVLGANGIDAAKDVEWRVYPAGEQGAGGVGGAVIMSLPDGATLTATIPIYDGNGNIVGLLNAATGTTEAQYEYGPFGETLRETGRLAAANVLRWSTKREDAAVSLVHYELRDYKVRTGRWTKRDPIGENGGVNLSALVSNSPVNDVDILGESAHMNYRALAIPMLRPISNRYVPLAGHIFLTFDEEGFSPSERQKWRKLKRKLGVHEGGINSFSFHPEAVYIERRKENGTLPKWFNNRNRLSVIVTRGAFVDVDNLRDDIALIANSERHLVTKKYCEQEKLLTIAVASAKTNNGGTLYGDRGGGTDPGPYSFLGTNCGHWAFVMTSRAGLSGPSWGARAVNRAALIKWNAGIGFGSGLSPIARAGQHTLQWLFRVGDFVRGNEPPDNSIPPESRTQR